MTIAPAGGEVADVYPHVILENDLVKLIQDSRLSYSTHREEILGLASPSLQEVMKLLMSTPT